MPESEIAQLRRQIQAEYEAAQRGFSGLASGTARHAFITARMERMSQYIQHLREQGKHEEAQALLLNDDLWLDQKG